MKQFWSQFFVTRFRMNFSKTNIANPASKNSREPAPKMKFDVEYPASLNMALIGSDSWKLNID